MSPTATVILFVLIKTQWNYISRQAPVTPPATDARPIKPRSSPISVPDWPVSHRTSHDALLRRFGIQISRTNQRAPQRARQHFKLVAEPVVKRRDEETPQPPRDEPRDHVHLQTQVFNQYSPHVRCRSCCLSNVRVWSWLPGVLIWIQRPHGS